MVIKKKKSKYKMLCLFLLPLVIGYFPLKIAVKGENYTCQSKDYIICREIRVTGCDWTRITESRTSDIMFSIDTGMTENEDFNFVDNTPLDSIFNLDIPNVYVVYGQQLAMPIHDEFYENVRYTCEDWEIVYPVKRQSIFAGVLPKSYLCIWDIL